LNETIERSYQLKQWIVNIKVLIGAGCFNLLWEVMKM